MKKLIEKFKSLFSSKKVEEEIKIAKKKVKKATKKKKR